MGDEVVDKVLAAWESLAFANGLPLQPLRPIADMVVNQLREHGLDDIEIIGALSRDG